jgi:hypothetical protein
VTLLLAFVIIKFILFPGLAFITGSNLPLVIVESCSMYHDEPGFDGTFSRPDVYDSYGISQDDTDSWVFPNGLKKGDIIFVVGAENVEVGDVIIFLGGAAHPIIHRLVDAEEPYATKGDNYKTNYRQLPTEEQISENQLIGKAVFRIPYLGWVKLIFFDWKFPESQRGFCK